MASNGNAVDEMELQTLSGSGVNPEARVAGKNSSGIPPENAEIAVPPQSGPSGAAEGAGDAGAGAAQPLLPPGQIVNVPAAQREQSCWSWCKETIQNGVDFIFIPQKENPAAPPSSFSMFLIFLGMILYLWDIASDITLAVDYHQRGRENYFRLTLIFIIGPILFVTIVNIITFLGEEKGSISVGRWVFRIFFVFVGPLIRNVEAFIIGIKCRNAFARNEAAKVETHKKAFNNLGAQAGALKLFETFLEAAPQATLNIYVLMTDSKEEKPASVWQIVSLCTSISALGWSIASFNRRAMVYVGNPRNIAYIGSIIDTLGNVCVFLSRTMAFGLFASACPTITVIIVCVSNWFVMTVFACILKNFLQNFNFDKKSFEDLFLNVGSGWMFCFVFHNISEGRNPRRYNLAYYTVSFIMNSILLFSWFYLSHDLKDSWDLKSSWLFIGGNYLLFFVGLFLLVMYHFKYHPTGGVVPILGNVNVEPQQVTPPVQLVDDPDSHYRLNINGIFDLPMGQVHSIKSQLNLTNKMMALFLDEFRELKIYRSDDLGKIGVQIVVELRKLMQVLRNLDLFSASRQTEEETQSQAVQVNLSQNDDLLK